MEQRGWRRIRKQSSCRREVTAGRALGVRGKKKRGKGEIQGGAHVEATRSIGDERALRKKEGQTKTKKR